MKFSTTAHRRLRWFNLPTATLITLLQRTPVLPLVSAVEECVFSSPVVAVLKSAAALAGLGAMHSLAGATTLSASQGSPITVTAGAAMTPVAFTVTNTINIASWKITGTIPAGLMISAQEGGTSITDPGTLDATSDPMFDSYGSTVSGNNTTTPILSGIPTTAGTYTINLQAFEFSGLGGLASGTFSYTVKVNAAAVVGGGGGGGGGATAAPAITVQPLSVTANSGGTVAFTVTASSTPTYQWRKNGVNISGATSDTLILNGVSAADAASYTVVVSNSSGSATSNAATLSVTSGQISRISNLSVRTNLGSGQGLTVGFVTSGSKNMLIRADGPSLFTVFGLTGFFADPQFSVVSGGKTVASDDDWPSSLSPVFSSLGAFPLTTGSKDAAMLLPINGAVTAQVGGTGSGVLLVEVYDDDAATAGAKLTNVSARNQVGTGANVLVSGFVVDGSAGRTLLIRGIGPALHDVFGVSGNLADPVLEIHETINGVDTIVASNDNWNSNLTPIFDQVGAYHFNAGSKDAALLVTLPPGVYTAQVSGASSGTGDGVVEVYVVP